MLQILGIVNFIKVILFFLFSLLQIYVFCEFANSMKKGILLKTLKKWIFVWNSLCYQTLSKDTFASQVPARNCRTIFFITRFLQISRWTNSCKSPTQWKPPNFYESRKGKILQITKVDDFTDQFRWFVGGSRYNLKYSFPSCLPIFFELVDDTSPKVPITHVAEQYFHTSNELRSVATANKTYVISLSRAIVFFSPQKIIHSSSTLTQNNPQPDRN